MRARCSDGRRSQRFNPPTPCRDRGEDRDAEVARQPLDVDIAALSLGDIDHVEGKDHRASDGLQLECEPEHEAKIGGVGDADDHVGRRFSFEPPQHRVPRHNLVRAAGSERIGARQIQHDGGMAIFRGQAAFLALDRHARVVGHLLARTCQGVEHRGLAAVRIADKGDPDRLRRDLLIRWRHNLSGGHQA